jgi:high-affinity iron transporter
MLPAYILSLREGLEAALIIGIVFSTLRKMQRADLLLFFWFGAGSAAVLSIVTALLLTHFGLELKDPGEAIFEGLTMLLAAGILTGMIFWMARQSRNLRESLETNVQSASMTGKWSLFGLAFVSVLREGVELALFLTAAVFASDAHQTLFGSLFGLGSAALLSVFLLATTTRLDLRRFFQITGIFLILFAAGLIVRAAGELIIAGWIPALLPHIWNTGKLLSDESVTGQTMGVLFGYSASPSLMQLLAYMIYFVVVIVALLTKSPPSARNARAT